MQLAGHALLSASHLVIHHHNDVCLWASGLGLGLGQHSLGFPFTHLLSLGTEVFLFVCVSAVFPPPPPQELTAYCPPVLLQAVEDGSVDPGSAAPGRCSAPDAVAVRSALPHRGATLSVPLDRGPAVVSRRLITLDVSLAEKSSLGDVTKGITNSVRQVLAPPLFLPSKCQFYLAGDCKQRAKHVVFVSSTDPLGVITHARELH